MANKTLFKSIVGKFMPSDGRSQRGARAGLRAEPKHALAQYAATGCLNRTFYASAEDQLAQGARACAQQVEPEFIAKTAVYCRERGFMKDMPALLCAVLSVTRPGASGACLSARDRQRQDAAQLRADHALGRGRPQVARHARRSGWCASGSRRARRERLPASVGQSPSLADIIKMVHPKPADARARGALRLPDRQPHDARSVAGDRARRSRRSRRRRHGTSAAMCRTCRSRC